MENEKTRNREEKCYTGSLIIMAGREKQEIGEKLSYANKSTYFNRPFYIYYAYVYIMSIMDPYNRLHIRLYKINYILDYIQYSI